MAGDKKIYVDFMSQPARALIIFCRSTNIDVQEVLVNIAKREHLTPEYRAINPLGKIPCYAEADFSLGESAAIMKYLAATNDVADHWYPADPRHKARVDSAIDWHHNNVRRGSALLILNRVINPRLGLPLDLKAAGSAQDILTTALKVLERYWLASTDFMTGDEISIADLLAVTELDMLHMLAGTSEGKSRDEILRPFKKVSAWMQRVADRCSPHHAEVSKILLRASAAAKKRLEAGRSKL